ncbi:hypothetical protein ACP4OV_025176 [Aristida adscensionis]
MHGGAGSVTYCKIDICGEEVTSPQELANLRRFLQPFTNAEHLHLESPRLGFGLDKDVHTRLPVFFNLHHLELRGRLPDDDDDTAVAAMIWVLEHAPNLETISLVFHSHGYGKYFGDGSMSSSLRSIFGYNEEELLDAHHLRYNRHAIVEAPSGVPVIPPCLRSRVRKMNLVHYQGGTAQRTLAKLLLCNASAMEELWCDFAEGPLWTQTQLMREIKGWVVNKRAKTHFS